MKHAGVAVPASEGVDQLETYFKLLRTWNAKVNLTALPLERPTDQTFDRLFVEPLAAARVVSGRAETWLDVGTGGGSPAIPLKVACPRLLLTMIEGKTRKVAFLREVMRAIGINADVEATRFQDRDGHNPVDLVTIRAVRLDEPMAAAVARSLKATGQLLFFQPTPERHRFAALEATSSVPLTESAWAVSYVAVPRGTSLTA